MLVLPVVARPPTFGGGNRYGRWAVFTRTLALYHVVMRDRQGRTARASRVPPSGIVCTAPPSAEHTSPSIAQTAPNKTSPLYRQLSHLAKRLLGKEDMRRRGITTAPGTLPRESGGVFFVSKKKAFRPMHFNPSNSISIKIFRIFISLERYYYTLFFWVSISFLIIPRS